MSGLLFKLIVYNKRVPSSLRSVENDIAHKMSSRNKVRDL